MATGSTSDFVSTRSDIISGALRKVKSWPSDGNPPLQRVQSCIKALNRILRQEDLKGTQQSKHLWALSTAALPLVANRVTYASAEGLPTNILDLAAVSFRDLSGNDNLVEIISSTAYAQLTDKNDTGDTAKVWLQRNRLLASQKLYVHPVRTSIGTPDEVTGSDALNYTCILKHTSAAINKPITGSDYPLYWKQTGSSGSAWVTATAYANAQLLYLTYKRPLFDFDTVYDNPDFPPGWDQYLIYRLAIDLAPESDRLTPEDRAELKFHLKLAQDDLFPSSQENNSDNHNKSLFF